MTWELRLGDCLDPVTGLASLSDGSVDHVITDPPYEEEAHTQQRRIKTKGGGGNYGSVGSSPVSFEAITDVIRLSTSAHAARLVSRWCLVFCQAEAVAAWRESCAASGLTYKRPCIWVKPDGQPSLTGDRPGMGYESIVAAHATGRGRSRWNGGGKCGVYYALRNQPSEHTGHPTQKPVVLMEALIRDFTDPGDLVVDPFAGSGTTGVACIRLGRRFLGWERDPKFHASAFKRLTETHEQPELMSNEAFRREAKKKRKQMGLGLEET